MATAFPVVVAMLLATFSATLSETVSEIFVPVVSVTVELPVLVYCPLTTPIPACPPTDCEEPSAVDLDVLVPSV